MTKFSNKITQELLYDYWDEQSFSSVVQEVIRRTIVDAAAKVQEYVDHREPASIYAALLKKEYEIN